MAEKNAFLAALTGAAIGGAIAALATGDVWALPVALVAGVFVYIAVGAALDVVIGPEPSRGTGYLGALVLAVAACAAALLYVILGGWLVLVAVVLLAALVVLAVLAMLSGR